MGFPPSLWRWRRGLLVLRLADIGKDMVNLTVNRADAVNGPPLVAPVYFSNDAVGPRGKFNAPSEKRIVNTARDEIEAVTDAKLFERVGFHLIREVEGWVSRTSEQKRHPMRDTPATFPAAP